jgi:hypothetical protein
VRARARLPLRCALSYALDEPSWIQADIDALVASTEGRGLPRYAMHLLAVCRETEQAVALLEKATLSGYPNCHESVLHNMVRVAPQLVSQLGAAALPLLRRLQQETGSPLRAVVEVIGSPEALQQLLEEGAPDWEAVTAYALRHPGAVLGHAVRRRGVDAPVRALLATGFSLRAGAYGRALSELAGAHRPLRQALSALVAAVDPGAGLAQDRELPPALRTGERRARNRAAWPGAGSLPRPKLAGSGRVLARPAMERLLGLARSGGLGSVCAALDGPSAAELAHALLQGYERQHNRTRYAWIPRAAEVLAGR